VLIRPIDAGDEAAWRVLWAGYCRFYGADVPERVTDETWRRILDPTAPIGAIVAAREGRIEGFANFVLHEFTWSDRPTCLLEDLYVSPSARGRGIGSRLIDHLVARGREEGWARVYWHTREDNAPARRVYDRFVPADGFVRYTIHLHGPVASSSS
jgi:GNAT superfamily N-acetyltransferase